MKKLKVIIDTDPGVDDAVAIIPILFEKNVDIKLFTTVSGNVSLEQNTKNLLHILEVYKKNIPVAKGAAKPLKREPKDAKFIHGEFGTGNYVASEPTIKPIRKSAVEAMYEVLSKNKGEITIMSFSPMTNIAKLIKKYPDSAEMIKKIIIMGTSDWNQTKSKYLKTHHISFNASSDPEALQIVLNSTIPLSIVPSEIGRESHLSESEVNLISLNKTFGKMIYEMLSGYWEPGHDEKFVAMNDTCAMYFLTDKGLFKTKKADILLDLKENPGKTEYIYKKDGRAEIATHMNYKKFHKLFFKKLEKIDKSIKTN